MSDNKFDATPILAIAYHSGFGHTSNLALAVANGARAGGAEVSVIAVDTMTDADWDVLDRADGIIFGSATYMGNVSAGWQTFAEKTGRRCMNGTWRDKVAAGFTNSGAKSGTNCPRWCRSRCSLLSTTCTGSILASAPGGTARLAASTI
jgi:NAD(P)H dehydrogenase (quinone)